MTLRDQMRLPLFRWQLFLFGIIPLAVVWGILFTVVSCVDPRPGAWHPVVGGLVIAGAFAGLLGAMLWAAGHQKRLLIVTALLAVYIWYSRGIGFLHYAMLVLVFIMGIKRLWRRLTC